MMERCLALLNRRSFLGLIVPLSVATTERMRSLQELLIDGQKTGWFSHFDVYPSKLFEGAKQRLTIVILAHSGLKVPVNTTRYQRWRPEERAALFQTLCYWSGRYSPSLSTIPKVDGTMGQSVLDKISKRCPASFCDPEDRASFYVHRIPYNYVKAIDFVPHFWNEVDGLKKSEDYKPYRILRPADEKPLLAFLNSNLFFWWWHCLFEGYHCGKHEIYAFPAGIDDMSEDVRKGLMKLAAELMEDLQRKKNRKTCQYKNTGKVVYDEFFPRFSKPILNEIDAVLAIHYEFTDLELDFIVNYDIKHRMGQETEEAGDQ
jgi:hypothetical protein